MLKSLNVLVNRSLFHVPEMVIEMDDFICYERNNSQRSNDTCSDFEKHRVVHDFQFLG
jgi:hypothetical protein